MDREADVVDLLGRPVRILTATHLTVFKALLDRTKDWADIEAMLAHGAVDVERVRGWFVALVGADDARLDRLTEAVRSATVQDPPTFASLLRPRRPSSSDTP